VLVDETPVESQGAPDPSVIYAEQFRYDAGSDR